jgi:hypothetical protein
MKKSMPFWLTLSQLYNIKNVKFLKVFLAQAFSIIWAVRCGQLIKVIFVRAGEDKRNNKISGEIANGE